VYGGKETLKTDRQKEWAVDSTREKVALIVRGAKKSDILEWWSLKNLF